MTAVLSSATALVVMAAWTAVATVPAAAAGRLPGPVQAESETLRKACRDMGGKAGGTGVLHAVDLNGDGIVDYVLQGSAVECAGVGSMGGQVAGEAFSVWVGRADGGAKRAYTGTAFEMQLDRSATPNRLWIDVAGRDCGQRHAADVPVAALEHCLRPLVWQAAAGLFALGPKGSGGTAAATAPTPVPATPAPAPAQAPPSAAACEGQPCAADRGVLVRATDVRTSEQGSVHYVTINAAVQNRTAAPMTLAVLPESATLTDDQGGRYALAAPVRGIGAINGREVDTSLTLAPGDSANTRFEYRWAGQSGQVRGTRFVLQFALREARVLPSRQVQLGPEHLVVLRQLADKADLQGAAPAAPAPAPVAAAAPAESRDPCAGRPRCFNARTFSAEAVRAAISTCPVNGYMMLMETTVKVRNTSDRPLVLAYPTGGATAVDDLGARWTPGPYCAAKEVRGMGLADRGSVDDSFTLAPGEARDVIFTVIHNKSTVSEAYGTAFSFDVTLQEYETLPGRQLRPLRQHSVSFSDLKESGVARGLPGAKSAEKGNAGLRDVMEAIKQLKK